jgi:hypothetical protein
MAFGDKLAEIPSPGQAERETPLVERVTQLTQRMNNKDSEIMVLQSVIKMLAEFLGYKI